MRHFIYNVLRWLRHLLYTNKQKRHLLVGGVKSLELKQKFQIDFLQQMKLSTDDYLLDIGCGTLRGGISIIKFLNKKRYFGIDIREKVLIEARKELKEENLEIKEPTITCFSDFGELKMDAKFDVIFAFSVLIHMEDSIVEKCIQFVSKQLSNDGVFYANVNTGETPEGTWLEFPMLTRSLDFYVTIADKYGLNVTDIGDLKSFGHNTNVDAQDRQRMLKFYL